MALDCTVQFRNRRRIAARRRGVDGFRPKSVFMARRSKAAPGLRYAMALVIGAMAGPPERVHDPALNARFLGNFRLDSADSEAYPARPFVQVSGKPMSAKSENAQAPAVEAVLTELKSTLTAAKLKEAQTFTSHLLHRVTDEDLAARPAAQWAAMAKDLLEFVRVRKAGTSSVRVFNPTLEEQGYESTHTVIEVVTED